MSGEDPVLRHRNANGLAPPPEKHAKNSSDTSKKDKRDDNVVWGKTPGGVGQELTCYLLS